MLSSLEPSTYPFGIVISVIIIKMTIIHFNAYLLTCRLKNTNVSYKASTETQIKHKTVRYIKQKIKRYGSSRKKAIYVTWWDKNKKSEKL